MNKHLYRILPAILFLILATSCAKKAPEGMPFSPYVEAFTTGRISRTAPVQLILNQEIPAEQATPEAIKKYIKFNPSVDGEFTIENNRTLVFHPKTEFQRNTEYRVTADFADWFGAEGSDRRFTFRFMTLPLSLRAEMAGLSPNEENISAYDVNAVIYTPDTESPETIESLVKFSENTAAEWEHSPDGHKHEVTLTGIPGGENQKRSYVVSVAFNKLGVEPENLLSFDVPTANDFSMYSIRLVNQPERFVEVTFTKPLDESQELNGLAYVDHSENTTVTSRNNRLLLYPSSGLTGAQEVYLSEHIRDSRGQTLGKAITSTIEISDNKPAVNFTGGGVIIPQSTELIIPFQAVSLRGVIVRVIKIMENNVGQFLQVNNLDQASDLMRVGRLMTRQVIFLDEDETKDLGEWNTYGIDLRELIEPEPGAIYRVQLSFEQPLSAYPCEDAEPVSKEQILADNAADFEKEVSRYDRSEGYYYYYDEDYYYEDYDWDYWNNYNYYEREEPCTPSYYYYNNSVVKNVLTTNLGLMAMAGETNEMTVLVHNLLTTYPEKGVTITLHNFQQQEIGRAVTDEKGQAVVKYTSGKPFYVTAALGKQRSYLRVDGGSALSLSTFDVAGEAVQKGIKGFIYGDRGVWRPGDTLYLSFMLNDRGQTLPASHPVTMELVNPLGQQYLKKTMSQGHLGLYSFEMPTDVDAQTGSWTVNVTVGGVTFSKRIRIETIKPNRLKIDIQTPDKTLARGEPMDAPIHIEWMTGATARNLAFDIQGTFQSTPTSFANYKNYVFDDPVKKFQSEESSIISGTTDENGNGTISARFDIGTSAPGMLMGNFVVRAFEDSGDFSLDAFRMQYSPYRRYVGILSPQQEKRQLNTGATQTYEVASVDYLGNPVPSVEMEVTVYKVYWYWWWSSDKSSLAKYVSDSYNKPVKTFKVSTNAAGKGTFDLSFTNNEWGTYYISVKDNFGGHSAGVMNYYDWPYLEGRRDADGNAAANLLAFKTDKETYAPGEQIVITFPSTEGSRAIVNILNGSRVLAITEHECAAEETTIRLDVTDDMQPNAYVYLTLLQPHGNTVNDLPIRMYGVAPVTVTSPDSRLHPVIAVADEIKPESRYDITVSEQNGKEMAYTLAIVDEGLLDLTRFKTPDPWAAFNAREALGVSTWDLYNYVVGAYGGRIEQLFSIGGDDALDAGPKAIVNRFPPVVHFEGPFQLRKGEKRRHWLEMPNYNGRVRVMVVAGDGKAYGNTEKSVFVRKPVMLLGTLPRVIGVNEEMVIPATVFATKENIGNVRVTIKTSDNMEVIGAAEQTLNFNRIEDKQATFRVRVKSDPGAGQVTLTASGAGDSSTYETDIEIRSVRRPQTKTVAFTLEPGRSWNQTVQLPGADGTNSMVLEMSDVPPVNLTSRLSYLLGYPHGCVEQITSKSFPQLYLKQFATLTREQEASTEEAVKETISRLRSYQMSDGVFSYWPGGNYYNGWATTYATHFLLEAEKKGFLVQSSMKSAILAGMKRYARTWKEESQYYGRSDQLTQAYRLYVLALAQSPETGAMNRLKENKSLNDAASWMLAAAYATIGRTDVATELIRSTTPVDYDYSGQYDLTYGSNLRDKAIRLLTLCLTGNAGEAAAVTREISEIMSTDSWLSTQTTAFCLVAMSKYMARYRVSDNMQFGYTLAGKTENIRNDKNIWSQTLITKGSRSAALEVANRGESTLFGRVIMEGIPDQGDEEAYQSGVELTVEYRDRAGHTVSVSELEQGSDFTARVTVRNPSSRVYRNLAITQVFPSGWEILNTRFLNDGATDENTPGVSYQDFRDDRVYSYIDYLPSGREVSFNINLSAIYKGKFYLPPVYCDAMYDRTVRANTVGTYIEVR